MIIQQGGYDLKKARDSNYQTNPKLIKIQKIKLDSTMQSIRYSQDSVLNKSHLSKKSNDVKSIKSKTGASKTINNSRSNSIDIKPKQ